MEDKLITIATFSNISDAYIFKNLLTMKSIESFVADSNASLTPAYPGAHNGGVRLSVRERDAARAISIINQKTNDITGQSGV